MATKRFTKEEQLEKSLRKGRERPARNRAVWFADKFCVKCGTTEHLELDHIDPATKVTNSIWTWGKQRRLVELAKCQVLCHDCHLAKSIANGDMSNPGESNPNVKLTEAQVLDIRASTKSQAQLGREYGVWQTTIWAIIRRKTWRHI